MIVAREALGAWRSHPDHIVRSHQCRAAILSSPKRNHLNDEFACAPTSHDGDQGQLRRREDHHNETLYVSRSPSDQLGPTDTCQESRESSKDKIQLFGGLSTHSQKSIEVVARTEVQEGEEHA
jgi:hypothetical protein